MVIGRTKDNDVQLNSRFISTHHAQLISQKTKTVLEDLKSTNGTFVNSKRVKRCTLFDGDIVVLGRDHKFRFVDRSDTGKKVKAFRKR